MAELRPVAFVGDDLPNLRGAHEDIRTLIVREPRGTPNAGPELAAAKSQHADRRTTFTTRSHVRSSHVMCDEPLTTNRADGEKLFALDLDDALCAARVSPQGRRLRGS